MNLLPSLRQHPKVRGEMVSVMPRPDVPEMPLRTCLGCGSKRVKQELLRFAVNGSGEVVLDQHNRQSGRGAYCCPDKSCLDGLTRKKGKLARAFRTEKVDCGSVQQQVDSFRREL